MKMMQLFVGASLLGLTACGGGGGGTTNPPITPAKTLATIRIPTSTVALQAGGSATLTPEALDASGSVISGATGYTYSSSASSIAEVQPTGTVLGIGAGSAVITASLTRDGVTATSTATVTVTGTLPATAAVIAGNADQTFTPPTLVVAKNASVTFTFGALAHNVTFGSTAGAPASVPTTTNASVARAFPTVGDFTYDCTLHAGMKGAVLVR